MTDPKALAIWRLCRARVAFVNEMLDLGITQKEIHTCLQVTKSSIRDIAKLRRAAGIK